jgi:uncharacterized membrane protein YfcA
MLSGTTVYPVAFATSFLAAALATPAGVSGAVLLLPFQVGVLGTPSPAVTPTNLLYNAVATPGAVYRYWRQGQSGGRLTRVLLSGTLPGVIAGSVIRVELLPSARVFDVVIAAVLVPLGLWLIGRSKRVGERLRLSERTLRLVAASIGCVGGIYGIGGGSVLAPILLSSGWSPLVVAPATLVSTLMTSIVGVVSFVLLSLKQHGPVAPAWGVGIMLGVGGLIGGYAGALLQPALPESLIRRTLGALVVAIGIRYALLGAT